ncbi:hypothetical protein AN958_03339 [Leucoagaricus sp. SymC.cos]|nr:hypothetical protein AN958_03339 [Leucoagaricus sp. SymC.cos]
MKPSKTPVTEKHNERAAAQQPPPARPMAVSAEAKHQQHVQTEEEGAAARMRGGCIPCPVSEISELKDRMLSVFRVGGSALSFLVHVRE